MKAAEIKAELQHLIDIETDISVLQADLYNFAKDRSESKTEGNANHSGAGVGRRYKGQ